MRSKRSVRDLRQAMYTPPSIGDQISLPSLRLFADFEILLDSLSTFELTSATLLELKTRFTGTRVVQTYLVCF